MLEDIKSNTSYYSPIFGLIRSNTPPDDRNDMINLIEAGLIPEDAVPVVGDKGIIHGHLAGNGAILINLRHHLLLSGKSIILGDLEVLIGRDWVA